MIWKNAGTFKQDEQSNLKTYFRKYLEHQAEN